MNQAGKILLLWLCAMMVLACNKTKGEPELKVGVTSGPHAQILEVVAKVAATKGLRVRPVEFADYVQPNAALVDGSLDANSFQHLPYLEEQRRDRGYALEAIGTTVTFPIAAYSTKVSSLGALPKGATLAIPNDPTNGARALKLLASAGVLSLPAQAGMTVSALDVLSTAGDYRIKELDAAQLARALGDVDLAVINTNYALEAGLDPAQSLLREPAQSPYANVIVVRRGEEQREELRLLVEAYHSDEVKHFVEQTFKGAIVVAW